MESSLSKEKLSIYVTKQLNYFFPDEDSVTPDLILNLVGDAYERLEYCFEHINNKYFFNGKHTLFSHLHGDQYSMFLYMASRVAAHLMHDKGIAEKLFLLNKTLHGIDAYFEIELPPVFVFVHPVGTVLGRASYGNFFMAYQRCGIGSNHDMYPTISEFVTLRPGAAILGNSSVGRNCTIATESLLLDKNLPDNTLYIGNPRNFTVKAQADQPAIWRFPKSY